MKKWIVAATLTASFGLAQASPGVMVGVGFNTTQGLGISLKVLSSDRDNRTVGVLGTSYYPATNRVGVDVGIGRTFENSAATIGWDIVNNAPKAGFGYVFND